MEPILRTIANVKKKSSGSFKVFSHDDWQLFSADVSNPYITLRLYVDSPQALQLLLQFVQQSIFQERMGGRKEEATSQQQIQLRLQTHFESLLSDALLQQYVVLVSSNKSTISFQRSALCNEGKKSTLSGTYIVATIK